MGAREVSREWGYIYRLERQDAGEFLISGTVFWSLLCPVPKIWAIVRASVPQQSPFLFSFEDHLTVFLFSKVRESQPGGQADQEQTSSLGKLLLQLRGSLALVGFNEIVEDVIPGATLPALSQSCKNSRAGWLLPCSFIEVMIHQSWSWLQEGGKQTGYHSIQNHAEACSYAGGLLSYASHLEAGTSGLATCCSSREDPAVLSWSQNITFATLWLLCWCQWLKDLSFSGYEDAGGKSGLS